MTGDSRWIDLPQGCAMRRDQVRWLNVPGEAGLTWICDDCADGDHDKAGD